MIECTLYYNAPQPQIARVSVQQTYRPLSLRADRGRYSQIVIPAEAGIQGIGVSFDKLRTNALSVYLPL